MAALLWGLFLCAETLAQIKTDGSIGPAAQTLSGPKYAIPQTLGQLAGNNLFHSFQTFNINSGESANFTTSTAGIANVISRVTGGSASIINGTLSLTPISGTPAFFFINPAGVTFGKGAVVDVPGALHISTANYLKFPDGAFHADLQKTSTLSSAAPEAFGFLGTTRATIAVKDKTTLSTKPLQPLNLIGGDIEINNGIVMTRNGGDIHVAAVGSGPQSIPLTGEPPAAYGNLSVSNGALVLTQSLGALKGGSVRINAGQVTIDSNNKGVTAIGTESNSTGGGGDVSVKASGEIALKGGGAISSAAIGEGDPGSLTVSADNLSIEGASSRIDASSMFNQGAGNINVSVEKTLTLLNRGHISSDSTSPFPAGTVNVRATNILIDAAYINSKSFSTGTAGNIQVLASGNIVLRNGGKIATDSFSAGNAGVLAVKGGNINIEGSDANTTLPSMISSTAYRTGNGGTVSLNAQGTLSLVNGGGIFTTSTQQSDAGSINIHAGNMLMSSTGENYSTVAAAALGSTGNAGNITVSVAKSLSLADGSSIFSSTKGSGTGGVVTIDAKSIDMKNGGSIQAMAFTGSSGNAGFVQINADTMTMTGGDDPTFVSTMSSGTGNSGDVSLAVAGDLVLLNGSVISSRTDNSGRAGIVKVQASNIRIDGKTGQYATSIDSQTSGSGDAGSVTVEASQKLSILNSGRISSATRAAGKAGTVTVNTATLLVDGSFTTDDGTKYPSSINATASANSSGQTGTVRVGAIDSMTLSADGELAIKNDATIAVPSATSPTEMLVNAPRITIDGGHITANTSGNVAAGTIVASADSLYIRNSGSISSDTTGSGNAGTVSVMAGTRLDMLSGAQISSATTAAGQAGSVSVSADQILMSGAATQISTDTNGAGKAGSVSVTANNGSIAIDTGASIGAAAKESSSGQTGSVNVSATQAVTIASDGQISIKNSGTSTQPEALTATTLTVNAPSITIDGGHITANTSGNVAAGTIVASADSLYIRNSGSISSDTTGSGNAGTVSVTAGSRLDMLSGAQISSATTAAGQAGSVGVSADQILMSGTATQISTDTNGAGKAGSVSVTANNGSIAIDTGASIGAAAKESSSGQTGSVNVSATQAVTIASDGQISIKNSGTSAQPEALTATTLTVNAPSITIDGGHITANTSGNVAAGTIVASADSMRISNGGSISSDTAGSGNAGTVSVTAGTRLDMLSGAQISSATTAAGQAGSVSVSADQIQMSGAATQISTDTNGAGKAGSVSVTANNGSIAIDTGASIGAAAKESSSGQTGSVNVSATQAVTIASDGQISIKNSGTSTQPEALTPTTLTVNAPSITIDGGHITANTSGNVAAGTILASAQSMRISNGGSISSDTAGSGNAGTVSVIARNLAIENTRAGLISGITSDAMPGSSGNAGDVKVMVEQDVSLHNNGYISSATAGAGSAGTVVVSGKSVKVDDSRIQASASSGSSGQTGSVNVNASDRLELVNGGELSIANAATPISPDRLTPSILTASAPGFRLKSGQITASSSGNVAASNIQLNFKDELSMDAASVKTSANLGNGGSISIQGGRFIDLINAQITTSVLGLSGDGGDITIKAHTLLMKTGFIQANTAAKDASGGNVNVDVRLLVPSGSALALGGSTPYVFQPGVFGFNVIQAAAPTGLSGTIHITAPVFDISGTLAGLGTPMLDAGGMGRNPCRMGGGSSLARTGRGGFAPMARRLLGPLRSAAVPHSTGALPVTPDEQLAFISSGCSQL
ncbi:MAG: filamentous hemagglutinin N-terminal domain-containing protein [Rhodoferax sp.]|nr:filamentous hemagglutinin N-terminal domain-containing protein [Rhodoferax sp.]